MKEFRVCPACGYGHGFHVFFREGEGGVRIGLICPSCGPSYDPGWRVQLAEEAPRQGPVFPAREGAEG